MLTKYIILYGSSLSAYITSTGMFWRASSYYLVCPEHLQQTNPFMSSNQYFMPVCLTTESSTETLMVTPLCVLLCRSWFCLKNSWIIQLHTHTHKKILWNLEALFYLPSTNAHFCLVVFYITALCKSYLKWTLNTTSKLMVFFLGQIAFCVYVK